MKFFTPILVLAAFCSAPTFSFAQTYSVGLAGVYGDDIDSPGFNARAYINSNNHKMCIGPEFTWFIPHTETEGDEELERRLFEFNFNGHYVFEITKAFGLYALTGVNYSEEEEDHFHNGELEESETIKEWGINLGGGAHYILNPTWIVFAEYDHLFSELEQNTFTLGLFYTFGKGFHMGGHSDHQTDHH